MQRFNKFGSFAATTLAVTLATGAVAQPAMAAVSAGLGGAPEAAAQSSSERSATVKKSAAADLLAQLAEAPAGKEWRWSVDSEATTATCTVYKTSDGKTFGSEADAGDYASTARVSYEKGVTAVPAWACAGKVYATEAEARAASAAAAPEVKQVTREEVSFDCSDGYSFATEDEARAHCDEATPKVTESVEVLDNWTVTAKDGTSVRRATEAAARAYADSLVPEVTSRAGDSVTAWVVDGKTFATADEALAYAQSKAYPITEGSATVHHDEVSHTVVKTGWRIDETGEEFDTNEECVERVFELNQAAMDAGHPHNYTYSIFSYEEKVVDQAAYDEQVPYWTCNGISFETREQAEAEAANGVPAVDSVSVPGASVWSCAGRDFASEAEARAYAETFRGKVEHVHEERARYDVGLMRFETRAEAEAYAASHGVTCERREGSRDAFEVAGRDFARRDAAEAYAASLAPEVSETSRDVDAWKTSDGKTFATEAEAAAYCDTAEVTYQEASETYDVEEEGHWELADVEKEAASESESLKPASTKPAPKHMAKAEGSAVPQTGDPASIAAVAGWSLAGTGAILAALRERRRFR